MYLRVYRVNKDLPEELIHNSLECNNIWDIDPGIYKPFETIEINQSNVEDLFEALENNQITTFTFEKSDIVELLPDEAMLNNSSGEKSTPLECNFLILTGLGWQQIAIDKEAVFRDMSIQALYDLYLNN